MTGRVSAALDGAGQVRGSAGVRGGAGLAPPRAPSHRCQARRARELSFWWVSSVASYHIRNEN